MSAETGDGLHELIDAITEALSGDALPVETDAPILVQERHRFAVSTRAGRGARVSRRVGRGVSARAGRGRASPRQR